MSPVAKNPLKLKGKTFGDMCEEIAAHYLRNDGYKILQRNFKVAQGEIDIIAEKEDFIIFVEVKGRKSSKYGSPLEAVTYWKQKSIRKVAQVFISKNGLESKKVRFDVIGITFLQDGSPDICHIPFAF